MNKMKRVVCFYRVSTKQQMIDDDIPVQRNACMDFIRRQNNWQFVGEYVEKGVSGFKMHASDREVLEELKVDAVANKFDIVLVFMFDRLGRIEEETPFVLKWFVDNGIEMWSVNEGQRKFDSHVDNLLNYITFWQASGESKKTQLRTLEAKKQMVQEGRFQGCAAPYGYKHISTGTVNAKGREIKKMVIDEDEAKIVKLIYSLMVYDGYGSRRIAGYLNDKGIKTKRGKKWAEATVLGIIKNSIYKGYFTYGRRKTDGAGRIYKNQYECQTSHLKYEDLVIVSEEIWEEAKKIIEARSKDSGTLNVPRQTKSPLLLTGIIYCNQCGSRMSLHYSYNHHKRKDGTYNRNKKPFYVCYGKENGITKCTNKNFAHMKIDNFVLDYVCNYLRVLSNKMDLADEFYAKQLKQLKELRKKIKLKKDKIEKIENEIKLLKGEIINVLNGTSYFTKDLLTEQIEIKTNELNTLEIEVNDYLLQAEKLENDKSGIEKFQKQLPNYIEVFMGTDLEKKKMLISKFVEWVKVDTVNIDVNVNIKIEELIAVEEYIYHHNA